MCPVIPFVPPKPREILKTFNWEHYPDWLRNQLAKGRITKESFNEKLANYGRTK